MESKEVMEKSDAVKKALEEVSKAEEKVKEDLKSGS